MSRAEYMAQRARLRSWQHMLTKVIRQDEYADSRLMVQIDSQAQSLVRIRQHIRAIREQMPVSRDPKGFRIMVQNWVRRRGHTLSQARADASRAGDDDKFIRMHKLYNQHCKRNSL